MKSYFRIVKTLTGDYHVQEYRNWGRPGMDWSEASQLLEELEARQYPENETQHEVLRAVKGIDTHE